MKGKAMQRVILRCWDESRRGIKGSSSSNNDQDIDDLRPPLLLHNKRARQDEESSSEMAGNVVGSGSSSSCCSRSTLCESNNAAVSCVRFAKKPKSLVTLLVGKERQVFKVEPQMLEHTLLQRLLEKTRTPPSKSVTGAGAAAAADSSGLLSSDEKENNNDENGRENRGGRRRRRSKQPSCRIICLDCDAILLEHILWLLNNDDPAVRQLNIDELLNFYE